MFARSNNQQNQALSHIIELDIYLINLILGPIKKVHSDFELNFCNGSCSPS
jgi:hypothetical protein